jgi:predicted phosphodiesterase
MSVSDAKNAILLDFGPEISYIEEMKRSSKSQQKMVILGDIHGRDSWKKIVEMEQSADVVVFVGDYFDSKDRVAGAKQLQNFKDIVAYKNHTESTSQKQVVLLFGNHDFHYMPWFTREPYSGYLPYMAAKYKRVLVETLPQMRVAFALGDVLVSHAGVSVEWLRRFVGPTSVVGPWETADIQTISDAVNETFFAKPSAFDFNGFNPFGDDPQQSPIWIRPDALKKANAGSMLPSITQVFGHTTMRNPRLQFAESLLSTEQAYFHADMLGDGCYLTCVNGEFWLGEV